MLQFSTEYQCMDTHNSAFPNPSVVFDYFVLDAFVYICETTSFWFLGWLLNIGNLVYILLGVTGISLSRAGKA